MPKAAVVEAGWVRQTSDSYSYSWGRSGAARPGERDPGFLGLGGGPQGRLDGRDSTGWAEGATPGTGTECALRSAAESITEEVRGQGQEGRVGRDVERGGQKGGGDEAGGEADEGCGRQEAPGKSATPTHQVTKSQVGTVGTGHRPREQRNDWAANRIALHTNRCCAMTCPHACITTHCGRGRGRAPVGKGPCWAVPNMPCQVGDGSMEHTDAGCQRKSKGVPYVASARCAPGR